MKNNDTNAIKYTTVNGIVVPELCDLLKFIDQHGGASVWGQITGNIQNQTDLIQYIAEHGANARWGQITGSILDQADLEAILRGLRNQINILDETKADITALENMVTTNTLQEISGAKNFTGALTQNNDAVVTTTMLSIKQDTLVSGSNIKTINGASVLGSGDLTISATSKNQVVRINNDSAEATATLGNLYENSQHYKFLQFLIGYQSNMTHNLNLRFTIAFDWVNNSIVNMWKNDVTCNTKYNLFSEYNSSIEKFVVAVRNIDSASDNKDLYVKFNADGTEATITFAKTNVTYIVGSDPI